MFSQASYPRSWRGYSIKVSAIAFNSKQRAVFNFTAHPNTESGIKDSIVKFEEIV